MNYLIGFLAIVGALSLGKIIYEALLEWNREGKDDPLHLDQDTIDQIKLEREGHYVSWKDGQPIVLHKDKK